MQHNINQLNITTMALINFVIVFEICFFIFLFCMLFALLRK